MTGRYAIRTGATQSAGITLWEVTIAEALKSVGDATGHFGKWHLGGDRPEGRREPSHQGFDVPKDRAIDGVNRLPFLEGKQAKSNRTSVILHANTQLRAVKWHDWKLHYAFTPDARPPCHR